MLILGKASKIFYSIFFFFPLAFFFSAPCVCVCLCECVCVPTLSVCFKFVSVVIFFCCVVIFFFTVRLLGSWAVGWRRAHTKRKRKRNPANVCTRTVHTHYAAHTIHSRTQTMQRAHRHNLMPQHTHPTPHTHTPNTTHTHTQHHTHTPNTIHTHSHKKARSLLHTLTHCIHPHTRNTACVYIKRCI